MRQVTSIARGAAAGAIVGLLACVTGAGYIVENASIPGVAWSTATAVFVALLALSGAVFGALLSGARTTLDRWVGRRTSWAPPIAGAVAMAFGAAPSAAFGAAYFGALHAPFMGAGTIFAIAAMLGIGLATSTAWLDQTEERAHDDVPRIRRAMLSSVGLAIPVVAIGGLLAASTADEEVLRWFRHVNVALLGGALGAGLGAVFGLYTGLVVGAVRRLGAAPARVRVADALAMNDDDEANADPLAEEDAQLEERFAELEREAR